MKLRSMLLGGVAALVAVGTAVAADLPAYNKAPTYQNTGPNPFNWSGFYFGVNGGYAFAAQDIGLSGSLVGLENSGSFSSTASGGVGGLHAGFNWQPSGGIVWGVEGRFAATGLKSSATDGAGNSLTTSLPWEGSVVGKLGVVPDPRLMLYGFGGLAFGDIKQSAISGTAFTVAADNVHTGWTAGVGVEYAFTNTLIGGLEYRYTNLGSHGLCDPTVSNGCAAFNASTTAAWNEFIAKLSVKF